MISTNDASRYPIALSEPGGMAAEAFRTLRTNLLHAVMDPPQVIVLTSPGPREGKSTVCSNLGVVMAQANKRTLIMDCDLRRPAQHKVFGLRNLRGIVNVLVGEYDLHEAWQETPASDLKVLTAGPIPPDPVGFLDSQRFTELLDQARREFDHVLVDAPPTHPVSDPMILASKGDGCLLVFDSKGTRKGAVRQSIRGLESVGAKVIGTVMNNAAASEAGRYYGGYVYGGGR